MGNTTDGVDTQDERDGNATMQREKQWLKNSVRMMQHRTVIKTRQRWRDMESQKTEQVQNQINKIAITVLTKSQQSQSNRTDYT